MFFYFFNASKKYIFFDQKPRHFSHTTHIGLLVPLTKYRLSTDQLLKKTIQHFSVKTKLSFNSNDDDVSQHYVLEPIFADVSHLDSFLTTKSLCQLIDKDVMAVIGINMENLDQHISSILSYVGIPFLQINPSIQWENSILKYNSSVNLYPSRKILAQVRCELFFFLVNFFFINTIELVETGVWFDTFLKSLHIPIINIEDMVK